MTEKIKIDAVIFDMDGVIFDSESVWKKAFEYTNCKYNLDLTEADRQSMCGKFEKDIRSELKKSFPNLDVDEYRDFMKTLVETTINEKGVPLKIGFISLIKFLKENKIKTALATSSSAERMELIFKKANLNNKILFDSIVTSKDVALGKPNPMIFNIACDNLHLQHQNCIVLEDATNGIEAAYNAGCLPVMVIDLIKPNESTKKQCFKIYNNLNEVKNFMETETNICTVNQTLQR